MLDFRNYMVWGEKGQRFTKPGYTIGTFLLKIWQLPMEIDSIVYKLAQSFQTHY